MTDKPTKAELIREFMEIHNMPRAAAEFAAAIELGEIPGDVIPVEDDDTDSEE